jgi:hypothetical protein
MAEVKNDLNNLEPLLNTQQNQLMLTFDNSDSIDTKALAMLATNVALLIFLGQAALQPHSWVQITLVILPYILSLLLNIMAIWPRAYSGASIDLDEHPEYLGYDQDTLILQLISDTKDAIHVNSALNTQRWRYCVLSIVLTGLGTLALFAIL